VRSTDVGWRDRDYAKWTDEERRRFYGTGDPRSRTYADGSGSRLGVVPGVFLAVIVSVLAALALGQLPRSHPLVPALHFTFPALSSGPPSTTTAATIELPSSLPLGGFLTLHGQLPADETGTVTVEGAYDHNRLKVMATVPAENGSYEARIPLQRRGLLHLRVTYPDGHTSTGQASVG
jgi:hypothetical protein